MQCPVCNSDEMTKCTNSHEKNNVRKRTYRCGKCGSAFHTKEIVTDFKTNVASTNEYTKVALAGTNVLELRSMYDDLRKEVAQLTKKVNALSASTAFEDLQKEVLQLKNRVDTLSMLHG